MRRLTSLLLPLLVSGCAIHPASLTPDEIASYASDMRWRTSIGQEPVTGSVGLYEAMARALKYNLDHHVELMEIALRQQQLHLSHHSVLPDIVANSGYASRNNFSGGSSVELLSDNVTGAQSLRSSTSSEKDVKNADLAFSWHILDFGLSLIRARQAADEVLIADERRRKVMNRILEDVRTAYWRAVTAERVTRQLRSLDRRIERALADSQSLAARAQSSPLTALTYERELREIKGEIQNLNSDLTTAKAQLAALINIEPGKSFSIAIPPVQRPPHIQSMSAEEMIEKALQSRPELREVAYQQRINAQQAQAAILEMLPGISLDAAPSFNSNEFLFNNHWVAWGAKASWNLIKVFNYPARQAVVQIQDELLDTRALAVTMAIMTQVHVSRVRLIHARRKHRAAWELYDVQYRILEQIRSAHTAGKVSEQSAIREEMNTLVARIKLDLAFVELQNAFANLHASMGVDPFEGFVTEEDTVRGVEERLRQMWRELGDVHAEERAGLGPRHQS